MRAISHALTGTVIGLVVREPVIAVPLALISHYVCDAIPHYGANIPLKQELRSNLFRNLIYVDAVLCFCLVALLVILQPQHWLLAAICAFVATSPDMISAVGYIKIRRGRNWEKGRYTSFASNIQWFEKPIGVWVDVAWCTAAIIILIPFLR